MKRKFLSVLLAVLTVFVFFAGCDKESSRVNPTDKDFIDAAADFANKPSYSVELSASNSVGAGEPASFELNDSGDGFELTEEGQPVLKLDSWVRGLLQAAVPDDEQFKEIFKADGEKISGHIDIADELNAVLSPLSYGYKFDASLTSLLDTYLEAMSDEPVTVADIIDDFCAAVKTNPDKTLGEFRAFIQGRYGVDLVSLIELMGVDMTSSRIKAFNSRTFAEFAAACALIFAAGDKPNVPDVSDKCTVTFKVGKAVAACGVPAPDPITVEKGKPLGDVKPSFLDAYDFCGFGTEKRFVCWKDAQGNRYTADTVITSDVELSPVWDCDSMTGAEYDASMKIVSDDNAEYYQKKVWIHYRRFDHDPVEHSVSDQSDDTEPIPSDVYGDWALWLWQGGKEGRLFYPRTIDEAGAYFEIRLSYMYEDLGWENVRGTRGKTFGAFEAGEFHAKFVYIPSLKNSSGYWTVDGGERVFTLNEYAHYYAGQNNNIGYYSCAEMLDGSKPAVPGKTCEVTFVIPESLGPNFGVYAPQKVTLQSGAKFGAYAEVDPIGINGEAAINGGFGIVKKFLGWVDTSGNQYTADTVVTSDITLYGAWVTQSESTQETDEALSQSCEPEIGLLAYRRHDHLSLENYAQFVTVNVDGEEVVNVPEFSLPIPSDVYGDWGVWVWQNGNCDNGRLFRPAFIMECGAVFAITYNYEYTDCGWDSVNKTNKGLTGFLSPDKEIGFQFVYIPSMKENTFWKNDGGDRYAQLAGSAHFVYQGNSTIYDSMTEMVSHVDIYHPIASRSVQSRNAALPAADAPIDSTLLASAAFDLLFVSEVQSTDPDKDIDACAAGIKKMIDDIKVRDIVDALGTDFISAAIKQMITSGARFKEFKIDISMDLKYDGGYSVEKLELKLNFSHDKSGYKNGFLSANDYMFAMTVK